MIFLDTRSENLKRINELSKLKKTIKFKGFRQKAIKQTISQLIYIIKRIDELQEPYKIEFIDLNDNSKMKMFESVDLIHFFSQCLLLWSLRILEILKDYDAHRIPFDIRIARNILASHYGCARGSLKDKLNKEYIILDIPKISPNGKLTYHLGPLGSPAAIASEQELEDIKKLYKKYVDEKSEPNFWEICFEILYRDNLKINKKELETIENFLRNNGGVFTTSFRVIDFIISSLTQSIGKKETS